MANCSLMDLLLPQVITVYGNNKLIRHMLGYAHSLLQHT